MFAKCLQVLALSTEDLDTKIHGVIDYKTISGKRQVAREVELCFLVTTSTNIEKVFAALIKYLYFMCWCICYV